MFLGSHLIFIASVQLVDFLSVLTMTSLLFRSVSREESAEIRSVVEDSLKTILPQKELQQSVEHLDKLMDAAGFERDLVEPDGNCQFVAFAKQATKISGEPMDAADLRAETAAYLKNNWKKYENFHAPDPSLPQHASERFQDYAARMANDSEWGDGVSLAAIVDYTMYPVELWSIRSTQDREIEKTMLLPQSPHPDGSLPVVQLAWNGRNHYDAIAAKGQEGPVKENFSNKRKAASGGHSNSDAKSSKADKLVPYPSMCGAVFRNEAIADIQQKPQTRQFRHHWWGACANLSPETLRELWAFNMPTGPVPGKHKLHYIIIGADEPRGPEPRPASLRSILGTYKYNGPMPCNLFVYMEFSPRARMSQMQAWFPYCEWDVENWSAGAAESRCKETKNFHDKGVISSSRKAVNEVEKTAQYWEALAEQIQHMPTWTSVIADPCLAPVVSRCMHWAKQTFEDRSTRPWPIPAPCLDVSAEGYKWQARFEMFLTNTTPDEWIVTYVVSYAGNIGASKFRIYMCAKHGCMWGSMDYKANSARLANTKVVFFDLAKNETLDPAVIERLKNYTLSFTGKIGLPHVVVFSKHEPDKTTALAADKLHVMKNLGDDMTIDMLFPPHRFPQVRGLKDPCFDRCPSEPSFKKKALTN